MPVFSSQTISTQSAVELWEKYGSRVGTFDRTSDLQQLLNLTERKARILIQIRNLLAKSTWEEVFPKHSQGSVAQSSPAPKKRGLETKQEDDVLVVTHTTEEVNHPVVNLQELLKMSGTDVLTHEVESHKINTWSTVTKGNDGTPTVTRLWQVSASLRPRLVPLVPLDWNPPPKYTIPPYQESDIRHAVILPDMQIGFRWVGLNEGNPWAEPYHDRKAIDIALQILDHVQPEFVVLLGDNLDFQTLSLRWPSAPEATQTVSIALMEYRWLLHRIREICPRSKIVYMYGNHETRLAKYLDERAGELKGLTNSTGGQVVDLDSILGLSNLDITSVEYEQPYWLWDRVEIEHGRTVRAGGGSTAAQVAKSNEHSVIYGHIHRQEVAHRTVLTPQGKRELVVGSPGCLCRIDGIVPGVNRPDWQQGVGILSLADGMDEHLDLIRIQSGKAVYGTELVVGRDYVQEMVGTTGAKALLPYSLR